MIILNHIVSHISAHTWLQSAGESEEREREREVNWVWGERTSDTSTVCKTIWTLRAELNTAHVHMEQNCFSIKSVSLSCQQQSHFVHFGWGQRNDVCEALWHQEVLKCWCAVVCSCFFFYVSSLQRFKTKHTNKALVINNVHFMLQLHIKSLLVVHSWRAFNVKQQ